MRRNIWGVGLAVMCAVYMVVVLPMDIQADTSKDETSMTIITTQVPDTHTAYLNIEGKGSVQIEGQTYTQSQEIKIERLKNIMYTFLNEDGYKLNKVMYNGDDVTAKLVDNKYRAKPVYEDGTTIRVTFVKEEGKKKDIVPYTYLFINGEDSEWIHNTKQGLVFRIDGDFEKFKNIKIDGTFVPVEDYNVKKGSTIVTLKEDYLNTLAIGKHTLEVEYTDRNVSTAFTIRAADTRKSGSIPQTGDDNNVLIMLLLILVSTSMMAVVVTRHVIQKLK